jgi:hypothetical protein
MILRTSALELPLSHNEMNDQMLPNVVRGPISGVQDGCKRLSVTPGGRHSNDT